jgi:PAS domain S-box-containing protein
LTGSEKTLILAPSGRDGNVAASLLREAGRDAEVKTDIVDLLTGIGQGVGLAVITTEAMQYVDLSPLTDWLDEQPSWSDFPFVVLSERGASLEQALSLKRLQAVLGNVIVLERPFHAASLINVVDHALRGRRRQYQARKYLDDLREGEQRLQTALLAGRMGSWEYRFDTRELDVSPHCKANFGLSADDALDYQQLTNCILPDDLPRVLRAFSDSEQSGADCVVEYRVVWPDTSVHWLDTRARVFSDANDIPTSLVGVTSDITDRKSAEMTRENLVLALAEERERTQEALRGERALTGLLMTSVPAGIVAYDAELRVTIWNPVMARLFGPAAEQVIGHPLAKFIGDGERASIERRLKEALAGISGPVEEIEIDSEVSGHLVLESQHAPIRDGKGQVVGGAAFFREITDRRRAEEQLRQAQKMETIGQLTGGVAHDFNNLLAAIQGNLELLRKRMPDDPQLRRFVDGAMQGAQRGASLTSRLLAFARRQDLKAQPVDLHKLLEGMRGLMERAIGPLIEIDFQLAHHLPPAKVDPNQLELAILNLAVNARDAMPEGGRLTITLDLNSGVETDSSLNGQFVRLAVIDTGVGMDAKTLQSAIEPFFSTKELGKGTGLGLSMVHGLAVQLGGALILKSEQGKGTMAALLLPVSEDRVAPSIEEIRPTVEVRRSTILVVDDDVLINMNTVDMIEDLGHRAIEAHSGPEALEILSRDQGIDLIVTDFAMPGMTGAELARRARELHPRIPILLATGYAELPSGTTLDLPRLSKPYRQDDLAFQIGKLLPQEG